MAVQDRESAVSVQRHELDLLRGYDWVDARPASWAELPAMVALAKIAISQIEVGEAAVERVFRHHPECIFPFRLNGRIEGGIAWLFLNEQGLEALLLDEIDFSAPDVALLARRNEAPAAIYAWAMAARGRAAAGLGNVVSRLRAFPYTFADYYAQPATPDGARFLAQLGFERTPSFQRDLWTYRRICNRKVPMSAAAHRHAA
jgi:hypothetical protein